MNSIEVFQKKILKKDITIKTDAVEQHIQMSSEGDEKATEDLYKVLENDSNLSILQKMFEKPISSKEDRRNDFFLKSTQNIIPLIQMGKLSEPAIKELIVKRAKEVVCINNFQSPQRNGALSTIAKLLNHEEMFTFLNSDQSCMFEVIFDEVNHSDIYVEICVGFLKQPNPVFINLMSGKWKKLPPEYKIVIRMHLHNEKNLLHWLDEFDRGIFTYPFSSISTSLQLISEKLGFHILDRVDLSETDDSSPITIKSQHQKKNHDDEIKFIPIDKFLGQYFPQKKLIKLYNKEILKTANILFVKPDTLKRVVELHEASHAIVHLGRDADENNFNTDAFCSVDPWFDPSPLHEVLAQLLCYHCVKEDSDLLECFEELNR